jgi:hypothetical protein
MVQDIVTLNSDITLQLSITSDNVTGLPNQTLIAVFIKFISTKTNRPLKISILANEIKLLNMVRYEVVKTEKYTTIRGVNDELPL